MTTETVVIPEERKAVVIGVNGNTKLAIEKKTGAKIIVGDGIDVEGEALNVLTAANVIKAIGRGFSPAEAFLLLHEDYELDMITLRGETEKTMHRLMARVIGRGGVTRKKLEQRTHTCIRIYGKTISIIGRPEDISVASEAITSLLSGAPHAAAYKIAREKQKH